MTKNQFYYNAHQCLSIRNYPLGFRRVMLKDYKDYYDSKRLFPASLFIRVQINDSDYNVQPV